MLTLEEHCSGAKPTDSAEVDASGGMSENFELVRSAFGISGRRGVFYVPRDGQAVEVVHLTLEVLLGRSHVSGSDRIEGSDGIQSGM